MKKSKMIKNLIAIFFYLLLLLSFFAIWQCHKPQQEQEEWILFRIEDLKNPEQVLWFENTLLIVEDSKVKEFDFEKRSFKDFKEIQKDEILAEYENELVFVNYKNHIIYNPEEFATDIVIFNFERNEVFSKSFHETIKPLHIEENSLILIDNYLNSPERTYKVNLEIGEIELFEIEKEFLLQGEENIEIRKREKVLFNIPKVNDIMSFSSNENLEKIALVDVEGNIWLYFKKSK